MAGVLALKFKHTHMVRLWLIRGVLFCELPAHQVRVIRKGKR